MASSCSDWADPRKSPQQYFIAWGIPGMLLIAGIFIEAAAVFLYPAGMLWIGVSCLANAKRCGRAHCFFSGPLSIVFAIIAASKGVGLTDVPWYMIMVPYGVLMLLSYSPEWFGKKYFRKASEV